VCAFFANYSDSALTLTVPGGNGAAQFSYAADSVVMESSELYLLPGRYSFKATAAASAPGSRLELYLPQYANENNTLGLVYASAEILPGADETVLEFKTNSALRSALLRVVYGGGGELYATGISGESVGANVSDPYFLGLAILFSGLACIFFVKRRYTGPNARQRAELIPFFVCIIAAAASVLPLCRLVLPWGHDQLVHLLRIEGIADGLRAGQFPVRIEPTALNGYGYADPIMYPPLFLYIPAFFRLFGVSLIVSYQLFIFIINLFTAAICYFAVLRLTKRRDTATVSAAAYTMCLFRLICIFTRAALGEILAMAFLPLVFAGVYLIVFGAADEINSGKWYLLVGFSGLMNSHLLSVIIAFVLIALCLLLNLRRLRDGRRLGALVEFAALFLLVNVWVILPIFSMLGTNMVIFSAQSNMADHAVFPQEMFATFLKSTGLSGSLHDAATDMPLSVGGILAAGSALFIFLRFRNRKEPPSGDRGEAATLLGSRALVAAAATLFLASTLFPWTLVHKIPLLGQFLYTAQFPWRYFGPASLLLCVVLGVGYGLAARPRRNLTLFLALAVIFAASAPYLDMYTQNKDIPVYLAGKQAAPVTTYLGGQEYLRADTDKDALESRPAVVESSDPGIYITEYSRSYDRISFHVSTPDVTYGLWIELPIYYYPGYVAELDGASLPLSPGRNGVVRALLPAGASGMLRFRYRAPALYRLSEAVSLISVAAILAYNLRKKRGAESIGVISHELPQK
jgi:hypothetical protein